ncbi:MAG: hypothetical protein HC859_06420 [Bacteroidia bacterium]|nr:hypothetical protein [Bacteroidia bacterium]
MPTLTTALAVEYQHLFDTCQINTNRYDATDYVVDLITNHRQRYESVSAALGIPWYFVGILHSLEASCNFKKHLHNGDPLTARTKNVPRGRPVDGNPPFTWEESAIDALTMKSLNTWTDWSVPGMLYQSERYNGFGYRRHGINSPYLWSFSNQYVRGKYTADGIYSDTAVSKQCGAATLLRRMSERFIIQLQRTLAEQIKELGETVAYAPGRYSANAEALQRLLNKSGFLLRVDGLAGPRTSDAFQAVTGNYLRGDRRRR